jgi:hypothetical protein
MGLAAFYIKVGMLEKKYAEGENMHAHISFITSENHKLRDKAFDDEFLAQILLMSLPRDSTWETLVIALLQTSSDTSLLTSVNVSSRLMQEHRRLTGTDQSDNALIASRSTKYGRGKGSKEKKRCGHCGYTGHTSVTEKRRKKKGRNLRARGTKTRIKGRYPLVQMTLMVRQTPSIRQIMLPFSLNSLCNANLRMTIQSMYSPPTHL